MVPPVGAFVCMMCLRVSVCACGKLTRVDAGFSALAHSPRQHGPTHVNTRAASTQHFSCQRARRANMVRPASNTGVFDTALFPRQRA